MSEKTYLDVIPDECLELFFDREDFLDMLYDTMEKLDRFKETGTVEDDPIISCVAEKLNISLAEAYKYVIDNTEIR